MPWIYRLERKLGRRFGISNLILYVTATQLAVYVLGFFFLGDAFLSRLMLVWPFVMAGEVWRVLTFLVIPPVLDANILLLLLALYATYHIGTALESAWSTMLFNLFYVIAAVGAIIAAAITGFGYNYFIPLSMFLAYAYLYPDATFYIFYLLPVKARWLAIADWLYYGFLFITGGASTRVATSITRTPPRWRRPPTTCPAPCGPRCWKSRRRRAFAAGARCTRCRRRTTAPHWKSASLTAPTRPKGWRWGTSTCSTARWGVASPSGR